MSTIRQRLETALHNASLAGGLYTEQLVLTKPDMEYILGYLNKYNRSLKAAKVKKYRQAMDNCEWEFEYLEGNLLTFDEDLQGLSLQHRGYAFLESSLTKWPVAVNFVDRDFWLSSSVESRSAKDKIEMILRTLGEDVSDKLTTCLLMGLGLHDKLTGETPHVNNSPASITDEVKRRELVTELLPSMKHSLHTATALYTDNEVTTRSVPLKCLVTLHAFGHISDDGMRKAIVANPTIQFTIDKLGLPSNVGTWSYFLYRAAKGIEGRELTSNLPKTRITYLNL